MDKNSKKNSRKKKSSKRLRQKGADGNPLNGSTQQLDNPSNKGRRNRKNSQSKIKSDHAIKRESNEEHTKALDQKPEEIPFKENEINEKENAVKSKGVPQVNEGDEPTTETTEKDQNDQTERQDQEEKHSNEQRDSKEIENVEVEQVQPEPAQSEPETPKEEIKITVTAEGGDTTQSPKVEDIPSLTTPRLTVAKRARRASRPPSKQFFQRLREESDVPTVSPQTYLPPEPSPMLNSPQNSPNPRHSMGQQMGHALQNRAQNRGSLQLGGNPLAMEALQVKLKPTKSKESQENPTEPKEQKGNETQPKETPIATLKQSGEPPTDEPPQSKEMSVDPLEEKGEEIESKEEGKEGAQEPLEDPLRMTKQNPGCRCIIC